MTQITDTDIFNWGKASPPTTPKPTTTAPSASSPIATPWLTGPAAGPLAAPPIPHPTPPAYPPYPYPYAPAQRRTNGLAIASMVLGICWVWWIGSILAVVFGLVALKQIEESNGTQAGRGMAIAGTVLGGVGLVFLGLMVLLMVVGAASSGGGY